jgi:hypothetical protein
MRLQMLELDNIFLFPWKVLRTESQDTILLRGESCNTPGVCYLLSSGFKLKHDRLSGDEPNLNFDIAPLLYI